MELYVKKRVKCVKLPSLPAEKRLTEWGFLVTKSTRKGRRKRRTGVSSLLQKSQNASEIDGSVK